MSGPADLPLGATYLGEGRCQFVVWAPLWQTVEVHLLTPQERLLPLTRGARGYHHALVPGVAPGSLYFYRLGDQQERPDPASHAQPQDVHGPSQVVDPAFPWQDQDWHGLPLRHYVFYEIHVGTYTQEGTFDGVLSHLEALRTLGVTAIELMPVGQFPGSRNWGYDGVYPFAVQCSYGGAAGLKRLVNACHQCGIAVVLDVVYNHLGPEGNYLGAFGPYFTDRYTTPWGQALNVDGRWSDDVRHFFIANALRWVSEFHIDALRLDAVHAIVDASARPFLADLAVAVHMQAESLNRRVYLIAESNRNDPRFLHPPALGGYGLDGQWNDDFHHALHSLLTGEHSGYYQDFGRLQHLAKAWREGFVYSGDYSAYRQHRHGASSRHLSAAQFVVCAQNHDQVGNRMRGERLSQLVSFEGLKLAAAAVLLSPFLPLLFMGEEYGETAPFPYFISHLDPDLVTAVRQGRREEFATFLWQGEPPDSQAEATFHQARLDHTQRQHGHHRVLYTFYARLLRLRHTVPALAYGDKETMEVQGYEQSGVLYVRRWWADAEAVLLLHFGQDPATVTLPLPAGRWHKHLDSAEAVWGGPGSPVPAELLSAGDIVLTLPPESCILAVREQSEGAEDMAPDEERNA